MLVKSSTINATQDNLIKVKTRSKKYFLHQFNSLRELMTNAKQILLNNTFMEFLQYLILKLKKNYFQL